MNEELKDLQKELRNLSSEYKNGEIIKNFNKEQIMKKRVSLILKIVGLLSIIFLWKNNNCSVCGIIPMNTIIAFIGGMAIILIIIWN